MTGPTLSSPLVSTAWVASQLTDGGPGSADLVVVDASVVPYALPSGQSGYTSGDEQYLVDGHVPGAVFADLVQAFSDPDAPLPFTRPSADRFAAAAGALGIGNTTTVVVYDTAVGQWASRLWWLFRTFGYDSVAVLDGGLTKWKAESRALETGHVDAAAAVFETHERPELWASTAEVAAIVDGTASGALVCGLPPKEFLGEEGRRPRRGHIPGSISAPAGRLVDRDTNAVIDEDALRATFGPALGADRIVAYCAAGIAATADALALTLLGATNVAVYDGSLNEWSADAELPLATA